MSSLNTMSRLILVSNIVLLTWSHPDLRCEDLDNGQRSYNPMLRESKCSRQCFACDDDKRACSEPETLEKCSVDGFVGSYVIIENDYQRIWNFTLRPGEMTSMHRHDFDYSFVAIKPSRLEVYGEDGEKLFDFWATEASLRVSGDFLEPTGEALPYKVPRVHAARNIGTETYHEILFESKYPADNVGKSEL